LLERSAWPADQAGDDPTRHPRKIKAEIAGRS
jgi:hypothetical protein